MTATALARQQQAFVAAIAVARHADALALLQGFIEPRVTAARGLHAYRANARELALRALQAAYPVLRELVGAENFEPLAHLLWRDDPPRCGDIGRWGGGLAAAIESHPQLADAEPWLADVARLEWALHRVATAADAMHDPASFGVLVAHDPDHVALVLAPGCFLLRSAHAIVSVLRAHRGDGVSLVEAGERLRRGVGEAALVWREGPVPRLREAHSDEVPFLLACLQGASVAAALAAAPQLPFERWLAPAVHARLVVGARLLPLS